MNVESTVQGCGPARAPAGGMELPTNSADPARIEAWWGNDPRAVADDEAEEYPRDATSLLWKVTVAGAIFFAVAFFVVALG